jgi:hypothetical protein
MRYKLISGLGLLVFLPFILAGCHVPGTPIKIGDGGLLSEKPCAAPCFQNITPGVTTEQEALKIMSHLTSLSLCNEWDSRQSGGDRGIRCSNIGLTFSDQHFVAGIGFSPTQAITVSEILKKIRGS